MTQQELFDALTAANQRLADPLYLAAVNKEIAVAVKVAKAFKPKPCQRCNGEGKLSCFNHVAGGVCFACNGSGHKYNG